MRTAAPPALERVFLHRQAPNTQPVPARIARRQVRAELVLGGRGWVETETGWQEVRAGNLLWNCPGDWTIGRSDPDDPYSCLAVCLLWRGQPPRFPRLTAAPDPSEARLLADEALALAADEAFDRRVLGDYLCARLRLWIELHQRHEQTQRMPAALRRVLAAMEADPARRWKVAELARLAAWSPAHLHEVFLQQTGTTPHQWLMRRRLHMVRERLLATPAPIKQIAVECGFADSAALSHAFRARYGTGPLAHRKRHLRIRGR